MHTDKFTSQGNDLLSKCFWTRDLHARWKAIINEIYLIQVDYYIAMRETTTQRQWKMSFSFDVCMHLVKKEERISLMCDGLSTYLYYNVRKPQKRASSAFCLYVLCNICLRLRHRELSIYCGKMLFFQTLRKFKLTRMHLDSFLDSIFSTYDQACYLPSWKVATQTSTSFYECLFVYMATQYFLSELLFE